MGLVNRVAAVAVVAAVAAGGGATAASAYSISGGAYVGTTVNGHTFAIAGAYAYGCPPALTTFSGTATGADTTTFTPYYGGPGDCDFFGLPVTVTQSGTWNLKVVGGPDGGGWYAGELQIPSGTSTTLDWPIGGCVVDVAGPQTLRHGVSGTSIRMRNTGTGVELDASVFEIAYVAAGCPFFSGPDATYDTNGSVTIPGITIS